MKIEGNIQTATKFYVRTPTGDIKWVPSLETAKRYINNPANSNWYLQTIYATNEDIVKGYDGKNYLRSELPDTPIEYKKINDFEIFKSQAFSFLRARLKDFAEKYSHESIEDIISWKDSSILDLNLLAVKAFKYRDSCYYYYLEALEKYKTEFDNTSLDNNSKFYEKYMDGFPKF
jgi:hypothetical protein